MYCGAGASCFTSASQEDLKSKVVMWALFGRWIKLYGFSCYNAERVRERERERKRERDSSPSPSSVGTCLTVSNCCVYEMLIPHFDALYSRCLKLYEWRK
jgi:hypothetical protein